MKLSDHLKQQREKPEYVAAEKQLQFRLKISNAIIDGRIAKGWTQADLAERVGTKQANISRIECGVGNPTLSLLEKIFNILEVHHEWWIAPQQASRIGIQAESRSATGYEEASSMPCGVLVSKDREVLINQSVASWELL